MCDISEKYVPEMNAELTVCQIHFSEVGLQQ